MINRVVLVGRITRDIELRKTSSGTSNVSFKLACNRKFKQEGQPDADFINCVVWNKQADNMAKYCYKGMLIGVEGRIQTRNYEDRDGKKIYVAEVISDSVSFLESRNNSEKTNTSNYAVHYENTSSYQSNEPTNDIDDGFDIGSDDLPF